MQAMRIVSCENVEAFGGSEDDDSTQGRVVQSTEPWNGTSEDLERFSSPVSLASETMAMELIMKYSAREADAWGEAGIEAALAQEVTAAGLDGDLNGLGLESERRLMLSAFRQEKLGLLRSIISRLTHTCKVSGMLKRPIMMPPMKAPPAVHEPFSLRTQ